MKGKWIKRIIVIIVVLGLVAFGVYKLISNKSNNIEKKTQETLEKLNSYYMEATMEFYKGEDSRTYSLKVSYADIDDVECFKVAMYDKSINQEQIILRNQNGVYVLTPALNQVYKFKGDWPLNGNKPYLYQSMVEQIKNSSDISKLEDGYLIISAPEYKNMPSWTRQEMKFTKEYKPVWIHIYDDNNDVAVKINFSKVEFDPSFAANYFAVDENMNEARSNLTVSTSVTIEDLPLYPVNADVIAELKEVTTIKVSNVDEIILTYSGQDNFTIIESASVSHSELTEIETNGEIVEIYGTIGYVTTSSNITKLCFDYNGVSYQVWSNNLSVDKLIEVASGMEVVPESEK